MTGVRIGIFGLQGDIEEHLAITQRSLAEKEIAGESFLCRTKDDITAADGLIMPGGESTVIGSLARLHGTLRLIREKANMGTPILGTCAGLIILANHVYDKVVGETNQSILGLLDVTVERNAFGRQRCSFEVDLEIPILNGKRFPGVFIRAPAVRDTGPNVRILSKLGEAIVAVQQDHIIGTAFHPELTEDTRLHQYFVKMVLERKELA